MSGVMKMTLMSTFVCFFIKSIEFWGLAISIIISIGFCSALWILFGITVVHLAPAFDGICEGRDRAVSKSLAC